EHEPLSAGEPGDFLRQHFADLSAVGLFLWPWSVLRGVRHLQLRVFRERRPAGRRAAPAVVDARVHHDAVEPRRHLGVVAEPVERPVDLDEHVLRDVFRVVVVAGELVCQPVHHRPMALHERPKRRAVAGRRAGDQVRIHRRTKADVHCHEYDVAAVVTVDQRLPRSDVRSPTTARAGNGRRKPVFGRRHRILRGCSPRAPSRLRSPTRSGATSPSSHTSTTERPRWWTGCCGRAGRSAATSGSPSGPWTTSTWSGSAGSRFWRRTPPSITATCSSISSTRPATPISGARWSGRSRWSTASCCWWTRRKARCRRRGLCCGGGRRGGCRPSWYSTRSTAPTRACRRS